MQQKMHLAQRNVWCMREPLSLWNVLSERVFCSPEKTWATPGSLCNNVIDGGALGHVVSMTFGDQGQSHGQSAMLT